MEDFRIVLIVLGAVAILAVLVHGMRTMRRQQQPRLAEQPIADVYREAQVRDSEGFDQDGIGEVRVTSRDGETITAKASATLKQASHLINELGESEPRKPRKEPRLEPTLEPMDKDPVIEMGSIQVEPVVEPRVTVKPRQPKPAPEPKPVIAKPVATKPAPKPATPKLEPKPEPQVEPAPQPQDVLVLNVVAPQGHAFAGPALFDALRQVGLRFGEMDIFHCHAEAEGRGPALFSLVNMVKPGTFSTDDPANFSTQGVSLFMTLPAPGEPLPAFELMLDCASSLAQQLHGQLLDAHRQLLTEQGVTEYRERIHIFERNQLLNAS